MTTSSEDVPNRDWTVKDYLQLDDGSRYELLDGEFVGMSAPGVAHQWVATRLGTVMDSIALAHDLGICIDSPLEVVLGRQAVVQPDIAFFQRDNRFDVLRDRLVAGVPNMILEVTEPDSVARTRGKKRELYARVGVPWLVLVDVASRTVESYRRMQNAEYAWFETASGSESLTVPWYPDLSVDLSKIWPPANVG